MAFRFRSAIVCGFATMTLSACSGDLSALDPAGPSAGAIASLWWVMLAGAAVLFCLIMALLFIVVFAPGMVKNIRSAHWIVGGGIMMPIPILIALLGYAFVQGEKLFGARTSEPMLTVVATARMWGWEFTYQHNGMAVRSRDVMHIPVGQAVRIETTSLDVIHSFWVPRLGGKIDSIPGKVTSIVLKADIEGTFGGICAEYCGEGHRGMSFRVQAHRPSDFENTVGNLGS